MNDDALTVRYRTLFISDVHLGKRGCQADFFLDFLRHHDADTIFLIGDMIDGWALRKNWFWPLLYGLVATSILGAIVTWLFRIETTGIDPDAIDQAKAPDVAPASRAA